eukprot:gene11116-14919_t
MLRSVIRNTLTKNNISTSSFNTRYCRFSTLGDDSHDDFKAKKKSVPDGMEDVVALIDKQVKSKKVLLYMKGTPERPQCGFSQQTVRILNAVGVRFDAVNVLEYQAIREGVKLYSDWPTIPQLYVNGEFIGGCDIVTSLYKEGELEKMFNNLNLIEND